MKKLSLTLLLFLPIFLNAQTNPNDPQLKLLIDSLYIIDQQVQQNAIEAYQRSGSMDTFMIYETIEHQTFERHIPIINKIYTEYGYPTNEKVGNETSSAFFTLVQHADKDILFQNKMLPIIKKLVDSKQIEGRDYAFPYDRVQINSGKEQLYGTQLDYDNNGNAIPKKLYDAKNVNKRRIAFNMETIEQYLLYTTEMHKQQNQKE
jgi:hypothetical protein